MQSLRARMIIASGLVLVGAVFFLIVQGNGNRLPTLGISNVDGVIIISAEEKVALNQPFDVSVEIDTLGNKVNAAGIYLRFDPKKLQLLDIDTKQSFCQFYPEKKFDNNLGTVSLACGSPHPGLQGTSTMLQLKFLPILVGSTTIRITEKSQMLASDGKGTNILSKYPQVTVNIAFSF